MTNKNVAPNLLHVFCCLLILCFYQCSSLETSNIVASVAQPPNDQQPYNNNDYQSRYNPYSTQLPTSKYDNPLLQDLQYQTIDGNVLGNGQQNYNYYEQPNVNRPYDNNINNNFGGFGSSNYNPFNRNTGGAGNNYDSFNSNIGSTTSNTNYYDNYNDELNFCPEHWIPYRQTCYRFIRSPKRSWIEAKKICRAYNSQLVNVNNIEQHSFILKELIVQNQRQNRFWVSARQTGQNSWVNDDGSQFLVLENSFSFDERQAIENEDVHDNRFLVQNEFNRNNPNQFFRPLPQSNSQTTRNQNNLRGFFGPNSFNDNVFFRDRVVYAFSQKYDRWMFMPAFDFELNLFICESKQLYTQENINLKLDDQRPADYGLLVYNIEKMPRGPYFIKQPNETVFDVSKNRVINDVTLRCLAGGYPTPTYRWYREIYRNATLEYEQIDPLQNDRYTLSGGNLIIYDPQQALDQGVYHCVADNKFGRIRSESAHLNFGFIMEFNLKRSAETAKLNWGKSIYCDPPQLYPEAKFYWSRDYFPNFVDEDQRVFVSDDGYLYFSYIELVDRANYSCTVQTHESDNGRNGPFFPLRVLPNSAYQTLIFANTFPKVFPEAPVAGKDIRLECVAFGYPIPSYNWTRKGQPLQRNAYMTNYNRVLIIQNATTNDNGEYTCTITNKISIEKSVYVSIQMKPQFTIPLKDKIKDHDSEVTFICEAFAIPDANYTWYKNAEQLTSENVNKDRYIIQDNVLTIKYLDPAKDDGMYQCGAQNQLKTAFSSAQLRVLSMKPSFKKRPLESEIYATYNGNVTIVCDPEAAPRPKIQWKKDGQTIAAGGHRRVLPSGTLIISPTSRDDEGFYTCIASNKAGADESIARLIILQEVRFVNTPPPLMITRENELVYMQCDAVYDELLDVAFIWRHNGELLRNDHDGTRRIFVEYNRLTIYNVTMMDAGNYECVVKTSVYEIPSRTKLTVEGRPGAPGGVQVMEIGKTKALIEFVDGTNNGRPIRYYNILGRTNWNRTWANVSLYVQGREIDRNTMRQQAEVTNLTPWSSYEFSVVAVNDLGIGAPSAPSPIYSTHEDKPYISPRNIGGGGGKIGDLTITWNPLLPQEQHSPGIHYKVFWRLLNEPEWASEAKKNMKNAGVAVVNIPRENYYTQYEVKVQAINNVGDGPISQPAVIYSAEDMPQVAPQKPIGIPYNSTAFNVTWQPISLAREHIRGKLIGHRIKYWQTVQQEENSVFYLSRTTRNWAMIVGLQPDTMYFVKVMAYNAAGEGPESERFEERTYRKAPQKPPSSLHIYGVNPSTIRVVWRYVSPEQDEEPVEGYKVRVWESDQNMITANDTIIKVGSKLETMIYNLTPGKSYKLRVLAYSNGGDGRMSTLKTFQMGKTTRSHANRRYNYNLNVTFIVTLLTMLAATFYSK